MSVPHDARKGVFGHSFVIPSLNSGGNAAYPPYFDVIIAGGIGGSAADAIMHSVDTVKTRLQGQPLHRPFKYTNMMQAYRLILKEEGVLRGLYAGVTPAMLGSVPGTLVYFSIYEFTKRTLTSNSVPEVVSHLAAGSLGDLAASIVYVPSEVLKTRMQLQGRYNNPHFISGYNYRNTWHAASVVVKYDGWGALFHGFKATILRDVPYSAIQFACYERFKKIAHQKCVGPGEQLPVGIDLLTGSLAGGIAGAVTTPLDVMKTVLQTQHSEKKPTRVSGKTVSFESATTAASAATTSHPSKIAAATATPTAATNTVVAPPKHYSGIVDGLMWNYKHQGMSGLFRGIGPRVFWTSLQSAIMFVIFEQVLHVEESLRSKGEWPPTALAGHVLSG
ncbi:mitochondrial carrier domain-containing protein [Radiomyces spectabilis]|uniref:mitochondrial carrier domain-containing protein n=1 Tax=Radiomyces spectabilis TaxID=64574 RepID=UPI00221F865D|nr:mitochondrial carrier domain-containing protein [Radiomyces spectabilis]KAI8376001.1 mitochondrial carrier domain-containing protein [Radiomyces spectabilis]